jgi:hypothetical protein
MPGDPVTTGCGCVLTLAVLTAGVAVVTVWVFLNESGLVYPLALGLALWVAVLVTKKVRRWTRTNAKTTQRVQA